MSTRPVSLDDEMFGYQDHTKETQECCSQLQEKFKDFPLHAAILVGNVSLLNEILNDKNITEIINMGDDIGNTPLHYAALKGNKKFTEYLLYSRANIDAVNKFGVSVLDFARKNNSENSDIIKYLEILQQK